MTSFFLRLALLAALACLLARGASAHDWYPYECCSGHDCAPLADARVRETPTGYVVIVMPGEHPMWPRERAAPLTLAIAYGRAKASPDGRFHLCINGAGELLCWFAAVGGF